MANEKRLIDANALKREFSTIADRSNIDYIFIDVISDAIEDAPTVDAVEVVHGRWEKRKAIVFDDEMVGYRCSKCNTTWDAETNYCPNCGAKMDGGNEDG